LVESGTVQPRQDLPTPSPHALALAGWPLVDACPPLVEALEAAEVVVVISRSRDPEREVHLERCRRDGVSVVQRPSGGGAVVLAPGVVAASALHIACDGLFPEPYFARFCSAVAAGLSRCGIGPLIRRGVSDLCLGDRKIAGTSLRLWRSRVLFQTSVLVDVDVSLLQRYLAEPSRAPAYRAGRSHRDFVTTLREAGFAATGREVAAALASELSRA
jgi:lipoate-protein ligase A